MDEQIQIDDISNLLIIIPKGVVDALLKEKNPAELIALYTFYYYTAKWQKTNRPKATINYVAAGLKWGVNKTRQIKQNLIKIGLIEDYKDIDKDTHKVKGWYIHLNYIFKQDTVNKVIESHPHGLPEGGLSHRVEKSETNALSSNIINALSSNNNNSDTSLNINTDKDIPDNSDIKQSKEYTPKKEPIAAAAKKFIKPTIDEIDTYLKEEKITSFTAEYFFHANEAKGWVTGKNNAPIKNWKSVVKTWVNMPWNKKELSVDDELERRIKLNQGK